MPRPTPGMALALGLKAVRSDLFAFLEEDDFWLGGHIASLLALAETAPPGRAYAYSGVLRIEEPAPGDNTPGGTRPAVTQQASSAGSRASRHWPATSNRSSKRWSSIPFWRRRPCCGSSTSTIWLRAAPGRWCCRPICQPGRTRLFAARDPVRGCPGWGRVGRSGARGSAARQACCGCTRWPTGSNANCPSPAVPVWSRLQQAMQRVVEAQRLALSGKAGVLALEGGTIVTSIDARDDLEREPITLLAERIGLEGRSRLVDDDGRLSVAVRPPESAWAYGVRINLDETELLAGPQWIVVEFPPVAEAFGIGLLDREDNFLARMQVPASAVPVEAWLHVPDPAVVGALDRAELGRPARRRNPAAPGVGGARTEPGSRRGRSRDLSQRRARAHVTQRGPRMIVEAIEHNIDALENLASELRAVLQLIDDPGNLLLRQALCLAALCLERKPDVVLDLGTGRGNSAAVFSVAGRTLENLGRDLTVHTFDTQNHGTPRRRRNWMRRSPNAWCRMLEI